MLTRIRNYAAAAASFIIETAPNFFRGLWTKFTDLFMQDEVVDHVAKELGKEQEALEELKEILPEVKDETVKNAKKALIFAQSYAEKKSLNTLTKKDVRYYRRAVYELYRLISDEELMDKINDEVEADIKNKTTKK